MDAYLTLDRARRRLLCEEAASQLGLAPASIEKDLWICCVLRELFALPEHGGALTFKGGTSLSKGWKLIQRFSEDVDVVIGREHLGFGQLAAPDLPGISGKQRAARLEELQSRCQAFISEVLLFALRQRLGARIGTMEAWRLELDPDDVDQQTLRFDYPSEFAASGYVRPVVKIELGARSDTAPVESPEITPYLAEALPSVLPGATFRVRTVAPVRTFWEKAMLLHEEGFRAASLGPKPRLSRHYYDLWCLITKGIGAQAGADLGLFDAVAQHRGVFFRKSCEAQESLRRGTLKILPGADHFAAWKRDYEAMRETMFFQDPPSFEEVLAVIGEFERRFNAGDSSPLT